MLRSHNCNELSKENIAQEVTLSGWVSNRRESWLNYFYRPKR